MEESKSLYLSILKESDVWSNTASEMIRSVDRNNRTKRNSYKYVPSITTIEPKKMTTNTFRSIATIES